MYNKFVDGIFPMSRLLVRWLWISCRLVVIVFSLSLIFDVSDVAVFVGSVADYLDSTVRK